MAKTKNKKHNQSDNVQTKKDTKKVLNPFEVHINKEKMAILGRKLKNDRGLPGVSRAKALKKRKETLLQEYKHQNKSNKFTDRRIGEKNATFTSEDKVMARFTAVRMKQHKKSIFNLADDEVLTHKGQTLSEIEKFDDPRSDDDDSLDDTDKSGKLDRSFVADAHFGGGILKKTGREGAKTHRELIEQLISESKKRKAEKQKLKEATLELTEKLDTEWKDLLPLVSKSKKSREDDAPRPKADAYDKVMRELIFEARGVPSDRLKTEDEIAKEEKERLERLELERIDRMKGFVGGAPPKSSHRGADDLDDDFVYESDPEYMLTYNQDGRSNVLVDAQLNGKTIQDGVFRTTRADQDSDDDASQDGVFQTTRGDQDSADVGSDDDAMQDGGEDENESEDDLSDLKADSSDESETDEPKSAENASEIKEDLLKRKEMMEKAREELPYTFELPKMYDDLRKLLENRSPTHQAVVVERMLACHHPSLGKDNKEGLGNLFAFLLQHLNDCASDAKSDESIRWCFEVFGALAPKIYELAHLNQLNAHLSVKEVIKEKHGEYRKRPKVFPGLEMLVFFKLVGILFSTSDFRHQIVSACFVFMEQIFNKCRIKTKKDIAFGIFIATLVLEYTMLSKRFLPAAINYLGGLVHMAVPKAGVKLIQVNPPFKATCTDLVLVEDCSTDDLKFKMEITDLVQETIDNSFKIRSLYTILKLIGEFDLQLMDLPSNVELFADIVRFMELLPTGKYPPQVQETHRLLMNNLKKRLTKRQLRYIVMEASRPKALRLYEPKIVEIYDGKTRKVQSREKSERDKLLYKLKMEKKGAMREIRRDKAFLGRVKIKQRVKSDQERRDKVKRIFSEASIQQGELNTLDRKNKKKK